MKENISNFVDTKGWAGEGYRSVAEKCEISKTEIEMKIGITRVLVVAVVMMMVVVTSCVDGKRQLRAEVEALKRELPVRTPLGDLTGCELDGDFLTLVYVSEGGAVLKSAMENEPIMYLTFCQIAEQDKTLKRWVDNGYGFRILLKSGDVSAMYTLSRELLRRGMRMSPEERGQVIVNHHIDMERRGCEEFVPDEIGKSVSVELIDDCVMLIADMNIDENTADTDVADMFTILEADWIREMVFRDERIYWIVPVARCGKGYGIRYRNPLNHEQYVDIKMTAEEIMNRFDELMVEGKTVEE